MKDVEAELVAALAFERRNRGKHQTIIGMAIDEIRRLKAKPEFTFGFASWANGSFELIVRNRGGDETTLHGELRPGQFGEVDRILPSCVYVDGAAMDPAPERR